jgi:hypothetical protein
LKSDSFSVKSGKDPNWDLFSYGFLEARRRSWLIQIWYGSEAADTLSLLKGVDQIKSDPNKGVCHLQSASTLTRLSSASNHAAAADFTGMSNEVHEFHY